jgi:hypothetical protein
MKDDQGNNKGYFDVNDWKTRMMCLPIQHPLNCDENQAEQVLLYALLDEGKIEEIEGPGSGKFEPTERLVELLKDEEEGEE